MKRKNKERLKRLEEAVFSERVKEVLCEDCGRVSDGKCELTDMKIINKPHRCQSFMNKCGRLLL